MLKITIFWNEIKIDFFAISLLKKIFEFLLFFKPKKSFKHYAWF